MNRDDDGQQHGTGQQPSRTRRRWLPWWPAALLGAAAMAAAQSGSPHLAGNDGYYHLKMAALLPQIGYTREFPWLRWTLFSDGFVSHHHGFHTLLAPFVAASQWLTGDAVLGGKVASVFALAICFALFAAILARLGARHPLLWCLLLCAAPWHFWLRMAYVRAPMAGLPLMLLAVLWALSGRTLALGLLAFVFVHVYGGGVLFPLIPAAFLGGAWLAGEPWRVHFRQVIWIGAGLIAGFVVNPYFPANFSFFYTQLFETGLGAPKHVGSEWKPYVGWNFLAQAWPVAVVWVGCLAYRLRRHEKATTADMALLLLNAGFLALTLRARRFVEYWPVFAVLSAAALASTSGRASTASNEAVLPDLTQRSPRRRLPLAIAFAVAAIAATLNLRLVRAQIEPSHDVIEAKNAMTWLAANSPPRSLLFTDDWDIFPTCFYFNDHNIYAVGLDPEFTRTKYPALWERYRRITRGEAPAKLPKSLSEGEDSAIEYSDIAEKFGAGFVLVDEDHRELFRALERREEQFRLVYPTDHRGSTPPLAIFEVLAAPGATDR